MMYILLGKTTLLNLLANRIPHYCLKANSTESPSLFTVQNAAYHGSGSILFNGRQPSSAEIRSAIGYGKSYFIFYFLLAFVLIEIPFLDSTTI